MAKKKWTAEGTAEEKWKTALTEAAQSVLDRYNLDWYKDNEAKLEPLFKHRNQLYARWLSTGKVPNKKRFNQARREARKVMREVKNLWFQTKASEVEKSRFSGKIV